MTATKSPHAAWKARRRLLQDRGQWEPFQPPEPVRDHIDAVLAATGLSQVQFAACAGLPPRTITAIRLGYNGKVATDTARKILAVTPATARPTSGPINVIGSRRRLQALAWAGWSPRAIAAHTGLSMLQVCRIRSDSAIRSTIRVDVATAAKINSTFAAWWDKRPPEGTARERQAAARVRGHADREGWVAACAWDNIDNPAERPKGVRRRSA